MTKNITICALQPITIAVSKFTPEQLEGKAPPPVGAVTKIEISTDPSSIKSISITHLYEKDTLHYDGIALSKDGKYAWITDMGTHSADWSGLNLPPDWDKKERREAFPQADGRIFQIDLEKFANKQNALKEIVGSGLIVTPKQIIIDEANKYLYWCDREGMRVFRSNPDGSNITCLVQRGLYPQDMSDMSRHCVGVFVDESFLYWTQKGGDGKKEGSIYRCRLEVPENTTPSTREDIQTLLTGLPEPIDLLIYEKWLFWTARGKPEDGGNSLNRATITSEGLTEHQVLFNGFADPIGLTIDEASENLFVGDLGGFLWVAPLKECLSEKASFSKIAEPGPMTGFVISKNN